MLPAGCGWCVQTVEKIDRSWGTYPGPEAETPCIFHQSLAHTRCGAQSVFNDVLESAVCACVARHRGAGCHFAHEASFLAHFDAAARDEFVWKLGPERTRPTPTTDPWVSARLSSDLFKFRNSDLLRSQLANMARPPQLTFLFT
jgi:hypothetical protein